MGEVPPKSSDPNQLFTHMERLGRADESPAERTIREAYNDHGRALEQIQKGNMVEMQNREASKYPLNEDGDEDK